MITKEKIDEVIKHEEEIANEYEKNAKHIREKYKSAIALSNADDLEEYMRQHRQLAEWLKELKKFKEQQPCEDVVSRQEVLEQIHCWVIGRKYLSTNAMYCLTKRIQNLPSVTPAQKKGHWKWEEDWTPSTPVSPAECNYAGWVCSECGEFPDEYTDWDNPDEKPTYEYCPNCGSEMRED